jgi:hypothetical protein
MDVELIDQFCLDFYGYGELCSNYWFVGMEEGGENAAEEFYKDTIEKWDKKPTSVIQDDDVNKEAEIKFFSADTKKIQKTWGGIIQLLLSIENKIIDRENILDFQKHLLGREKGNNLLLELMPLPHRNTAKWSYSSYVLPQFRSRIKYYRHYVPERREQIKKFIVKYSPKVVVFYSTTKKYVNDWKEIIGINENIEKGSPFIIKKNETVFVICNHPAFYNKKEYYPEIGTQVKKLLNI